jgi:hypothetical protein
MEMMLVAALAGSGVLLLAFLFQREIQRRRSELREALFVQAEQKRYDARLGEYNEALKRASVPPEVPFNLFPQERAIYSDSATIVYRGGTREVPFGHDSGISKTSGGVTGAIVGGLLLGPVGAVAGYAASNKKTVTNTKSAMTRREAIIEAEPGTLSVTNQRLVFIGEKGLTIETRTEAILQISVVATLGRSEAIEQTQQEYLALRGVSRGEPDFSPSYAHGRRWGASEVRFRRADALSDEIFIVKSLPYFMLTLNRAGHKGVPLPEPPRKSSSLC